jgi:Zn-dependent metalloprotease
MSKKLNTFKLFSSLAVLAMLFSSIQPPAVQAQGGDGLKREFNAESGRVSFLSPTSGKSLSAGRALQTSIHPQDPAMALAVKYAPEFGMKNAGRNLSKMASSRSDDGRLTVRFQQNYENVPVMGGELIVNTDDLGDLYSISGEVSPDISVSTQPAIDPSRAQETALQAVAKWYGKTQSDFTSTAPQLWIYDESLLRSSTRPVELTWRMEVTAKDQGMPVRELVLVNAQRGGISLHFNQVDDAGILPEKSNEIQQASAPAAILEATEQPKVADSFQVDALAATLYVSPAGNDSNICTSIATPCATINAALGQAQNGDVILVAGGRYTKTVVDGNTDVVRIQKSVTLRGGWNTTFSLQNSQSVIDGGGTATAVENMAMNVLMEKFTIVNGGSMNGGGSGIDNVGSLTLDQMTITGNYNMGASNFQGTLTIQNSTISGNQGPGLANGDGNTYVNNSTIANNTSTYPTVFGGGIRTTYGNVTITNTIVAGNFAPESPDCYAYGAGSVVISNGNNIIGNTSGCTVTATTGDKLDTDPGLFPLLPSGFHPLQLGSPALNAGNPATCTQKDQRGVLRLSNSKCDIGAYEYTPAGPVATIASASPALQRTPINAPFVSNLKVAALDADGDPVSGVSVTFSAPVSGPGGVFASTGTNTTSSITDASGIATASTFTANGQYGDYNVTGSAPGIATLVNIAMHNGAWLVSSTNGNDANGCLTIASPCASIQGVMDKPAFNSGETIWVTAGTYPGVGNTYYLRQGVNVLGGWNGSFSSTGGATVLQQWFTPSSTNLVAFKQVVSQGGGFENLGNLTLENSTVRQSDIGIWNRGGGSLTLRNVTLSENTVTALRNDGTAQIINSTITNNHGISVGGIQNNTGTVNMQGTILAGNIASYPHQYGSADCYGDFYSQGNNIVGTVGTMDPVSQYYKCRGNWSYDMVGDDTDPVPADQVLDSVATQDPATGQWVHALPLGSPAIDFGYEANCPTTDQRGVTRPQGTSCDSGAYEYKFNSNSNSLLIRTFNDNGSDILPGTLVCDQTDPDCLGGDEHAKAAHKYAIGTYNFYKNTFGRNSIDNAGGEILSTVHYSSGFDNAFWNGYMMIYGDTYGYPLADDIVAHELTHGVTQHEANLFYYYQSGAINESFSDLWGEYYDQSNKQGNDADSVKWIIGEDIKNYPIPNGFSVPALRSMSNPPALQDPDMMSSQYYYEGEGDNGGVHWNSGVNNKAVYLMVEGGTFNAKTVSPLGWEKVGAIYYEVNTNLLTSGADYSDLYYALQQACASLIGTHGIIADDCIAVKNAIDAVQMNGQPATNYNPDAPLCPISTPVVAFADDLENGTGNWAFTSGVPDPYARWQLDSQYGPYVQSGGHSLYADDAPQDGNETDASARLASFVVPSNGYLWFAQAYDFETGPDTLNGTTIYNFDGGVLEYSTNGGTTWVDAGTLMDVNKYKAQIYNKLVSGAYINPLHGRLAFVGTSHGYTSTRLNLSTLAGKTVTFRWRMGLDGSGSAWGWWVDNVKVYSCGKSATFADVPPTHPYFTDIEILYANGLTGGCGTSPLRFCPDQIMNRAQAAVFMVRGAYGASFVPLPTSYKFKDNWSGAPYARNWAEAMRETNLTSGCKASPLLYCPLQQLNREQAVVFGLKMKYGTNFLPPPATGTVFADMTNPKYWATAWAEKAYADGLITSCGTLNGKPKFCPSALVTRGLGAYIIVRAKSLTMP